ncbi:MAG: hypothetical protein WCK59_00245 [Candidatus Falkowbacteria bacterium]
MIHLKKFKALVFIFILQLMMVPAVFGASLNTKGLDAQDSALVTESGLASNSNLATIISVLIKSVLGFLGIIFLVLTIMAGFKWMNAQGNEDDIKKAQASLKNSIIGLVIVLAAYAITYSVFTYLPFTGNGSGAGGGGAL